MSKDFFRSALFMWGAILCTVVLVEASASQHLAALATLA